MFLDRQLQLKILTELRDLFPNERLVERLACFEDSKEFHRNIFYLSEHGLIAGTEQRISENMEPARIMALAIITAKGLDFLEDDGGLSAILGKVVVKFDHNDLAMLLHTVDHADGTEQEKKQFKEMLISLPGDRLKTMYTQLMKLGMDNLPAVLRSIEGFF